MRLAHLSAALLAAASIAAGCGDAQLADDSRRAEGAAPSTAVFYELVARHSGKALDVSGASSANGANVQQWERNGTAAQRWRFEPVDSGYFVIRAQCSGKALDVADHGMGEGANVQQWEYGGGWNQQWRLEDAGDGFYRVRARESGLYLDVAWAGTANGTNVAQVNRYPDDAAQMWALVPAAAAGGGSGGTPGGPSAPAPGWHLVWSDEFDRAGLPDADKWGYDVGGGGWGNHEAEYYTAGRAENARVEGGALVIEARREDYGGMPFTSARLVSKNAGNWLYGRIEARAKLPAARGTWPAIWMLSTDWKYGGWPSSGELDIMEHVGFDPGIIHGSIHTQAYNHTIGTQKTATRAVGDATSAFHTYATEWTADTIDVFVDDVKYFSFANEHRGPATWPFGQRFHLLLNLAVGGDWGAVKGIDDAAFPQRMEVDYVRVYQR